MTSPVADRYRRLAARFDTIVAGLTPAECELPSACDGWTVRDVIGHVADTERDFLGRMEFHPLPAADGDECTRWAASRAAMQAVLDDPARADHAYDGWFGPTTAAETIDTFYSMDLMVHAWDIAVAVGRPQAAQPDEPADIAHARDGLAVTGPMLRSPGICGPEVEPPADASEFEAFLAWTGRNPR